MFKKSSWLKIKLQHNNLGTKW